MFYLCFVMFLLCCIRAHVENSSGPDVFPEESFEAEERRLSHPSEAVAHPTILRLRVPEALHYDAHSGGVALALCEGYFVTVMERAHLKIRARF